MGRRQLPRRGATLPVPGGQDAVEGVAELQQLVLVLVEAVRRLQLIIVERPRGTKEAESSSGDIT